MLSIKYVYHLFNEFHFQYHLFALAKNFIIAFPKVSYYVFLVANFLLAQHVYHWVLHSNDPYKRFEFIIVIISFNFIYLKTHILVSVFFSSWLFLQLWYDWHWNNCFNLIDFFSFDNGFLVPNVYFDNIAPIHWQLFSNLFIGHSF